MIKLNFKGLLAEKEHAENRKVYYVEIQQKTGISRQTLSRIAQRKERNLRLETVAKLCKYFGCEIADLVEIIPDTPADYPQIPE